MRPVRYRQFQPFGHSYTWFRSSQRESHNPHRGRQPSVAVLHKTVGSAWSLRKDDLKIADKLPGLHGLSLRFETKTRKAFGIALISPAAIKTPRAMARRSMREARRSRVSGQRGVGGRKVIRRRRRQFRAHDHAFCRLALDPSLRPKKTRGKALDLRRQLRAHRLVCHASRARADIRSEPRCAASNRSRRLVRSATPLRRQSPDRRRTAARNRIREPAPDSGPLHRKPRCRLASTRNSHSN